MRSRCLIIGILVGAAGLPAAWAQPVRDVVVLAGQHYVRTQQFPLAPGMPVSFSDLAVFEGGCAFAFYASGQIDSTYLRQFDRWGNPLHDQVIVDPAASAWALGLHVGAFGADTWVNWDTFWTDALGRIFDHFGQPRGDSFPLFDPPASYGAHFFALTEQGAAVSVQQSLDDPHPHRDLYLRLYSPVGQPLTDVLPVATSAILDERSTGIAPLPDGGQVLGYHTADFSSPPVWSGYLRRVRPDLSMDPPVQIPGRVSYVRPRLLSDGTLLVQWVATEVRVQRFDANLVPLGDSMPVDTLLTYIGAASDGRFVAAGNDGGAHIWMRLYDANWQPLTERFEPMNDPPPCRWLPPLAARPIALGDDGTIWITWDNCDGVGEYLTTLTPFEPGDMNYDRRVDNFDITPFVMALADPAEYQAHYPGLPYEFLGDVNEDGQFDNFDISPFVQLLSVQ